MSAADSSPSDRARAFGRRGCKPPHGVTMTRASASDGETMQDRTTRDKDCFCSILYTDVDDVDGVAYFGRSCADCGAFYPEEVYEEDEPQTVAPVTVGREDYEDRRAARIDRLEKGADKAREQSAQAFAASHDAVKHIPMGQPILVGHHSEKRHRRDLDRAHAKARQGIDLHKKAQRLAERAEGAKSNRAISSDDPNAIVKIREKIAKLEAQYKRANTINAIVRSKKKDHDTKVREIVALGYPEDAARSVLEPDDLGKVGIQSFHVTGWRQTIRRLKKRICHLENTAALDPPTVVVEGKGRVFVEDNRVKIKFDHIPSAEARAELKHRGFKWARTEGVWQLMTSERAYRNAQQILNEYV